MPEETNTTAPLTPPIVEEHDNRRVIQLSAACYTDDFTVKQHVARFTPTCGINFIKLNSDEKKPKKYYLRHDEMEALVQGWQAYKSDLQAKEEAEQKRQATVIEEAYKLVQDYPTINIKPFKDDKTGREVHWCVTIPTLHYNTGYYETAYDADNFLRDVQEAVKHWQNHLEDERIKAEAKAEQDKFIAEAMNIVQQHERIGAREVQGFSYRWMVELRKPDNTLQKRPAHSARQLLDLVQEAKAQYDQWQAAQQKAPAETPLQG